MTDGGDFEKEKIGGWVWDAATWERIVTLEKINSWFGWMGWSIDGKLATTSQDQYLQIYDANSGREIRKTRQLVPPPGLSAWSPDGRQIADAHGRVWDVQFEGDRLRSLTQMRGVTDRTATEFMSVAWSPDGQRFATGEKDGSVRIWTAEGVLVTTMHAHETGVRNIAWSPDGERLATTGYRDAVILLWDRHGFAIGEPIRHESQSQVYQVAWSPDGKWLVSTGTEGARLWSADGASSMVLEGDPGGIGGIAWSPDGQRFATGGKDGSVRIWTVDGRAVSTFAGFSHPVSAIDWHPGGERLAAVAQEGRSVRVLRLDGTEELLLKDLPCRPRHVQWSPDGRQFAFCGWDHHLVYVYDGHGNPAFVLNGHRDGTHTACFQWHPDGQRLLSGGYDHTLRTWTSDGTPEWILLQCADGTTIQFSASGELQRGDPDVIEQELMYLIENEDGSREFLKPSQFLNRFGEGLHAPQEGSATRKASDPIPPAPPANMPPEGANMTATGKTLRVGPEEGMLTLVEAFAQAQGGDTIEIATDEPIVLTKRLSWNKPGTLTIRAAAGNRPILVAGAEVRHSILEFGSSSNRPDNPQNDTIIVNGLTLLDPRQGSPEEGATFLFAQRSITAADVTSISPNYRFITTSNGNSVSHLSVERCYVWQSIKARAPTIYGVSLQFAIQDSLFAGGLGIDFGYPSQVFTIANCTFIGSDHAWHIWRGPSELRVNKSLFAGLTKVGEFWPLTDAEVAIAAARLPRYNGMNNTYFQCERMVLRLGSKAETDLAAWQAFTNNGEKNPLFVDPQFARPDLVELARTKLLPPKAFALRPTNPLKRLKIGCDVDKLPALPPRLYDLLPPEIRYNGKLHKRPASHEHPENVSFTTASGRFGTRPSMARSVSRK